MLSKTLSHTCSCFMVLARKVDHSQNINTQQLFSCWEIFEIIIHQTSNGTGDTKIETAAGSHLSVFYRRKNTSFMGHVHDTEMSRWKTPCAVKTKTWHINVTELDRGRVVVDVEYSSASWLLACYQGHSKMRMVYGHVLVNFNWTRSVLEET